MNCAATKDLILNASEPAPVDAHVRQCEDCGAFREASLELDTMLMRTRKAPERLSRAVMPSIAPKLNCMPELLDFLDGAAMTAVMFGVIKELLAT